MMMDTCNGCCDFTRENMTVNRRPFVPKFRCNVCDGPASKYNYSVLSCNACRQFFKRIVNRKLLDKLPVCHSGNACQITVESRKDCIKCRFYKCLEMGMRPALVGRLAKNSSQSDDEPIESQVYPNLATVSKRSNDVLMMEEDDFETPVQSSPLCLKVEQKLDESCYISSPMRTEHDWDNGTPLTTEVKKPKLDPNCSLLLPFKKQYLAMA